jgi:NAD(P)-dependent dehydrogenase (short-subunit alcohol dehydrogenase family)
MGRLEGKGAVVLGAGISGNTGQAIARRFVDEGARVLVAGRNDEELGRLAGEIGAEWAHCDISRRAEVFTLAAIARESLGGVDIGVNATGWGLLKPFLQTTEEELRIMTALQFIGPCFFFQAIIGAMDAGGSLIQISAATDTVMLDDHAAYMGAKAATDQVLRCVAKEFGSRGIRANAISPGLADRPMTTQAEHTPGLYEAFLPAYPLGRIGESEDIAAAAAWLASDECVMTGQTLQVNGGRALRHDANWEDVTAAVMALTAAT